MDDFAKPGKIDFYGLEPSESNFIVPGKCPLSSMSPTLVFHGEHRPGIGKKSNLGKIFMALGASGGPKIISSVSQVFQNHAIQGLPLFESMAHARIHCQLLYHGTDATTYEECPLEQGPTIKTSENTLQALERRKQRILAIDYLGTVQAVSVNLETEHLSGSADIRKRGRAAGY